jgi:pyruvate kinase
MLHETQRAMAPALHELLSTVSALRNDILAESEELYHSWQSRIERPAFAPGAQNLAAYLALRRRDLRTLQASLMRWGLSSLGRSESRVIASLDAVVASLGSICAATRTDVLDYPDEQQMFAGTNTIAQAADAIFGRSTRERQTRIMVTLPTEAGEEPRFLRTLLQQGIECVRINCAHDDPDVWTAMLTHLRNAEQAVGRTEPVRVLMDLGGPRSVRYATIKRGKSALALATPCSWRTASNAKTPVNRRAWGVRCRRFWCSCSRARRCGLTMGPSGRASLSKSATIGCSK